MDWNIVVYIGMILIVFGFGLFLYAEMKELQEVRKPLVLTKEMEV